MFLLRTHSETAGLRALRVEWISITAIDIRSNIRMRQSAMSTNEYGMTVNTLLINTTAERPSPFDALSFS